jgi:hypothetical protein
MCYRICRSNAYEPGSDICSTSDLLVVLFVEVAVGCGGASWFSLDIAGTRVHPGPSSESEIAMPKIDKRGWMINGAVGVDMKKLVELYRQASVGGKASALTITAEALAAESTALANPAAEASAFVAAQSIREHGRGK